VRFSIVTQALSGGVAWVTLKFPLVHDSTSREVVLMNLESAISDLQATLAARTSSNWRWLVRQRLSAVRQALSDENFETWDGWLAARGGAMDRERRQLLARITAVGSGLLERVDADRMAVEVRRLLADVEHYRQRVHDLIYDSVALEIGGSE
jgi:recombinational DNA repair ATPase RecF